MTRPIFLPPWRVDVTVREGLALPASMAGLSRMVAAALDAADAPAPGSVGLILTDDAELTGLNATHMGKDGPTDVLSFPLLPPGSFPWHEGASDRTPSTSDVFRSPPGRRQHIGDIVISVERAVEQATAGHGGQTGNVRWAAMDELRLLAVHGTLHLCGWDHAEPAEEAAMRAMETRLLSSGRSSRTAPSTSGRMASD